MSWKEKTRAIPSSWGRTELDSFLDGIRVSCARRPSFLNGGGFSVESAPMTYFDLYSLDETFALYVVWRDDDVTHGIRSTEVVGFPDLRKRIEPDLFDTLTAIHQSPSAHHGLGFDSVSLIRAVNVLQPLGKENALKTLWAYDTLARSLYFEETHKYSVDEFRILPILRLLFEDPSGGGDDFGLGAGDVAPPGKPT